MVLPEPSRMVRDDWVWVLGSDRREWVAEAVANGSRRLGCRTVANGVAGPSQLVIGDGEARRRLGLGVRLDGDWVWECLSLGFGF